MPNAEREGAFESEDNDAPAPVAERVTSVYQARALKLAVNADAKSLKQCLTDPTCSEIIIRPDGRFEIDHGSGRTHAANNFRDGEDGVRALLQALHEIGVEFEETPPVSAADIKHGWALTLMQPSGQKPYATLSRRADPRVIEPEAADDALPEALRGFLRAVIESGRGVLLAVPPGAMRDRALIDLVGELALDRIVLWLDRGIGAGVLPPEVLAYDAALVPPEHSGALVARLLAARPAVVVANGVDAALWPKLAAHRVQSNFGLLCAVDAQTAGNAIDRIAASLTADGTCATHDAARRMLGWCLDAVVTFSPSGMRGEWRPETFYEVTAAGPDGFGLTELARRDGQGRWLSTGQRPTFDDELKARGLSYDVELFG